MLHFVVKRWSNAINFCTKVFGLLTGGIVYLGLIQNKQHSASLKLIL